MPVIDVSIVIVNWNGGRLLKKCLASIFESLKEGALKYEVVVVDNGSCDDSMAACLAWPEVLTIQNRKNLGFGRACNLGADLAHGDTLLFLNPDCEVSVGSIERCVAQLRNSELGICGIALYDASGQITRTCHRFPTVWNFLARVVGFHLLSSRWGDGAMKEWPHTHDALVDHVIGAFYATPRHLFSDLGGFDERFFVYLEDLDYSLRVAQRGLQTKFLASPASFHLGGGLSQKAVAKRLFFSSRSRVLYAYKHFPRWQGHLHLLLSLFVEPITRAVHQLFVGSWRGVGESLAASRSLWQDIGPIRRWISNHK